ncbi:MAG: uncharacterized protein QOJ39_2172 [Candidatus Eremiobacteraeota bacterium]|jgi:TPR repeat protein|nr:uncharacterized protein [Candidatus Eremiobacteraeota bacterium]
MMKDNDRGDMPARTSPNAAYDEAFDVMHGSEPDVAKALGLLERAHEAGDARATYALGTWYLHGKEPHVPVDAGIALEYIAKAASARVPDALYDLAVSYEKGGVVALNAVLAFQYYLRAALRGDNQSVNEVGRCYRNGIGVATDSELADIWYERADELGVLQ